MRARSRGRRVLARFALMAASALIAVAGAEWAVRLVLPQYVSIQTDRALWTHDEELGWIGRRGAEVLQGFDRASTVPVRINSRGFRDQDTPLDGVPGSKRFVVLGDSVAFGFGVPVEARLSEVAERRLACHQIEFVNLGVSGYSTDQELLAFRREGIRYQPAAVILVYVGNDRRHNGRASAYGHPKPMVRIEDGGLAVRNVPVPRPGAMVRAKYSLQQRSALYNLVRESSRSLVRSTGFNRWVSDDTLSGAGEQAPDWDTFELTTRLILQLEEEVEAVGGRFLLVVAVTDSRLERRSERDQQLLDWCRESGVDCLDSYPALRARAAAEPAAELFLQDGLHWTALGHQVVGEALFERMLELGWVPSEC